MKTRVLVGVIGVPLLFFILTVLPAFFAGLAVGVIAAFCMWELRRTLGISIGAFDYVALALAILLSALRAIDVDPRIFDATLMVLFALSPAEFIMRYEKGQEVQVAQIFGSVFAMCAIPYALSFVAALRRYGGELNVAYVLIPFISSFMTDAGAYFAGVFLGKRHAFPRVSPKKTVAGVVGGFCAGVAFMFAFWFCIDLLFIGGSLGFPWVSLLVIGLLGAAATVFGDLAFSLIKRVAGIKDYGSVLPGHGGMLDRFDSLIFTAPVIYILVTFLLPELIK